MVDYKTHRQVYLSSAIHVWLHSFAVRLDDYLN